jgi:outer membrane lipoprotein-sorting protein
MRRLIGLCVSLLVAVPVVFAQDEGKPASQPTDPVEILKKVDTTCKALKAVKYELTVEGKGELKERAGRIQATVIAARASGKSDAQGLGQKYVIDAKVTMPGSTEPKRITVGTDGEQYYVIRHDAKKAHVDVDPAVLGSTGGSVLNGLMLEYLHPTPFTDEINGKKRELVGSKKIDGVDCYEVHVVYAADQAPEATWFFSKKDFVPLGRIDTVTMSEDKKGAVEKTVSKLELNPKLEADAFKFKLPEGYTKTDEFAP